jgi:hypothetical protein
LALSHQSKVFGIDDAGIYKLSTDPAGAPPTYAAKVDIIGAQSMEMTLATDTKTLRGDNTLLAADSIIKDLTGKVLYAKWNFDVWASMTSMTASDSGSTPNQKTTMTMAQSDVPAYAKVEVQTKHVDYVIGDLHFIVYKIIPSNFMGGLADENYKIQEFGFTSVPLIGTPGGLPANSWWTATANETASAIV